MGIADRFQLWSQTSYQSREAISATTPWRPFNQLTQEEKRTMLLHFNRRNYFWGFRKRNETDFSGFSHEKIISAEDGVTYAVNSMNNLYKKECYAKRTLETWTFENVHADFKDIFLNQDENVVYELISLYGMGLIAKAEEKQLYKHEDESDEAYEKRKTESAYEKFDEFSGVLNEIFEDYKINVRLTRSNWIPQQEQLIIETIYEPVLKILSLPRWKKVNREIEDAFEAYANSTPSGYSKSMTHCYSAVQALLQELTGKANIKIKEASKDAATSGLIPNDTFTATALGELLSTFEQLRMQHGDAHPKIEYANEQTAKLMLNLTLV